MIPTSIIDEIKRRMPLSKYIESTGVELKRAGSEKMKCLCPFHDDSNPSLEISLEYDTFKCWTCDASGDVFEWIQKREGLSFVEAVEKLAEIVGVEIPRGAPETPEQTKKRESISALISAGEMIRFVTTEFWHSQLMNNPAFSSRLDFQLNAPPAGRGRFRESLVEFRVGATQAGDRTLEHVRSKIKELGLNFSDEAYLASGLYARDEKTGKLYEFYRDSYTYPQMGSRKIFTTKDAKNTKPDFGRDCVVCVSKKPFDKTNSILKYHQKEKVEVCDADGKISEIETVTDGKRAQQFMLNPRSLRADRLVIVEGENDLLAVWESTRSASAGNDLSGFSVAGIAGNLSDAELIDICKTRAGEKKETVFIFDNDDAGEKYSLRFGRQLLESGAPVERVRAIDWRGLVDDGYDSVKDIDEFLTREATLDGRRDRLAAALENCLAYDEWLISKMKRSA